MRLLNKCQRQKRDVFSDCRLQQFFCKYSKKEPIIKAIGTKTPKKEEKENPSTSFKEITNLFRNIDLDTVQKSVTGLQKAVSLISEIVPKNNDEYISNYEERPINKYYED